MEGSFSDRRVHRWLQEIADGSFLSLHYDTPALADASAAEHFGGGYTRQSLEWSQPSNRSIWLLNNARFTGLAAGMITHLGVWDSISGGEMVGYTKLPERVIILAGHGYIVSAGDLALSIG